MYSDKTTDSMRQAIDITHNRRELQQEYNKKHGITPRGVKKAIKDIMEGAYGSGHTQGVYRKVAETAAEYAALTPAQLEKKVKKLLGQPVTWSAAHIQTGNSWGEIAQGMPEDTEEKQ